MLYVALLRGNNVGGNNKIDMKLLEGMFQNLGYQYVQTYLHTGNVIFYSEDTQIEPTIHDEILKIFGLKIRVLVMDYKTYKSIHDLIPSTWTQDKDNRSDVMFLWNPILDVMHNEKVDTLIYHDQAILWTVTRENYFKSRLRDLSKSKVYKEMTIRNVNTVCKIMKIMDNTHEITMEL